MTQSQKSRGYVWRNPEWIPSERDKQDGSSNIGYIAYGRTHFRLKERKTPGEYGASCRSPGCRASGIVRLRGTPFEKKLDGKNKDQPAPLPDCKCIQETRTMRK